MANGVIVDYNSLLAAVQATAEDYGTEFAAYLPIACDLVEEFLFRDLELPDLEAKTPYATFSPNQNLLPKPTGYKFANYFKIVVNGKNIFLKKRRDDYIQDFWPDPTQTDVPKYYSDSDVNNFNIAPTPQQPWAYEIKYSQKPTKLSLTNPTNYYTSNCEDLLYLAMMVEMAKFMKAWPQVQVWTQAYSQAQAAWNTEAMRRRRDDGQIPQSTSTGPNDIKHTIKSNS
jgi:hypothetical protein